MTSIAKELLGIMKPPPASFFKPPVQAVPEKKETRIARSDNIRSGAAALNAQRAASARASTLEALNKLGKPSTAAQIGTMRGVKTVWTAMVVLNKLCDEGVLVRYKDYTQPRNPIVFWYADRANPKPEKWKAANAAKHRYMSEEVCAALQMIGKPATRGDIYRVRGVVNDHASLASIAGVVRTAGKQNGRDVWLYSLEEQP